jgi:hypothetical protein
MDIPRLCPRGANQPYGEKRGNLKKINMTLKHYKKKLKGTLLI